MYVSDFIIFAGIGRLVADSKVCPIVLPYWSLGMEDMFPTKRPYHPRTGHVRKAIRLFTLQFNNKSYDDIHYTLNLKKCIAVKAQMKPRVRKYSRG